MNSIVCKNVNELTAARRHLLKEAMAKNEISAIAAQSSPVTALAKAT